MKRNRTEKTCTVCGNSFDVIKSRELKAKFCSRECYYNGEKGRTPWNKNRSYEELYTQEDAERIRKTQSERSSGTNNPMHGKHHRTTSRKLMSKKKQNVIPWNTGKKFPGIFQHINRMGENNPYIRHLLKEEQITYEEYLEWVKNKPGYYRAVRNITNHQPIHLLENYDKRAKYPDQKDAYHLDHVFPIAQGFRLGVSPLLIGDISNLRFIPWNENISKRDKVCV